jgi:LacI family transcriptional regulator
MAPFKAKVKRFRVALLIESSHGYGRDLLVGIAQYLRIHGPWAVEFEEGNPCETLPSWFFNSKWDGAILRVKNKVVARTIHKLGLPAVDLYGGLPGLKIPTIRSDENVVGRLAAEHLLERGFRQFAFCGYNGTDWSDMRKAGFEQCVAEAGFPCQLFQNPRHPFPSCASDYEEHGTKYELQLSRWLHSLPKPVGVMTCNDARARQIVTLCQEINLRVPDDVAVIGVDKDEIISELSDLPISSVILDTRRIGYEAAALLNRMMRGETRDTGKFLVEPKGVATRLSTEVLAVEDRHIATALRFIRDHACDGMDIPSLLKVVPLSRSSLERRFAYVLKRSPKEEIIRVQLERAKQLLTGSDLKMSSVAEKAGFQHVEYLSRIFKKRTGLTLKQFRLKFSVADTK